MMVQFVYRALLSSGAALAISGAGRELATHKSFALESGTNGLEMLSYDSVRSGLSGKLRGPLFSYLASRPFSAKVNGRIGRYAIGFWPAERGRITSLAYQNPSGFIEVTPENQNTQISNL